MKNKETNKSKVVMRDADKSTEIKLGDGHRIRIFFEGGMSLRIDLLGFLEFRKKSLFRCPMPHKAVFMPTTEEERKEERRLNEIRQVKQTFDLRIKKVPIPSREEIIDKFTNIILKCATIEQVKLALEKESRECMEKILFQSKSNEAEEKISLYHATFLTHPDDYLLVGFKENAISAIKEFYNNQETKELLLRYFDIRQLDDGSLNFKPRNNVLEP